LTFALDYPRKIYFFDLPHFTDVADKKFFADITVNFADVAVNFLSFVEKNPYSTFGFYVILGSD
jgi:hypothetical protein